MATPPRSGDKAKDNPRVVPIFNAAAKSLVGGVVEGADKKQPSGQGSSSSKTDDSSSQENPAIKAVIDKVLPDLPCTDAAKLENKVYYKVDASSKTTKDQTPPAAWIEEKESDEGSVKEYFSEFANIQTTLEVPATEVSHYLSNEGDVVRASTLYLLHSVNVAAQDWLIKKGDKRKLICTSETPTKEMKADDTSLKTRTDIEWRLGVEESAPRVAVLEFKRKHTLNTAEINKAKFPSTRNTGGFLGSSAYIVKQATHYITKHYTPKLNDICVFDWDTLWILNYEGWDESKPDQNVPKCLLHQEQGENKWGSGQHTFRQLLLAFLIRALIRINPSLKSKSKVRAAETVKPAVGDKRTPQQTPASKLPQEKPAPNPGPKSAPKSALKPAPKPAPRSAKKTGDSS